MNNRKLKKWINKTLGKKIKNLRLNSQFSQKYVAVKMGISHKKYKKLEKGYYTLTLLKVIYAGEIFAVPINSILEDLDTTPS